METNQLLQADVLDILFENRNKAYGAYDLRKTYNKRLKVAVAVMITCCLFAFLIVVAGKNKSYQSSALIVKDDVTLEKFKDIKEPPVPPLPPPPPPAPRPIATIRFTTPVLTNEPLETPPPAQTDMDNIAISTIDNPNGELTDAVAPPKETQGVTNEAPRVTEDYTREFKSVQVEARFPGGTAAWIRYLERTLRTELPTDNGAPTGVYSVVVSFLVDREGNISEVKAENDPGYGTAAEAVRAIQNGPKWTPAMQNGRSVIYRQRQTITFRVQDAQ